MRKALSSAKENDCDRCACTRRCTIARLDRAKARERAAMLRAALRVRWKEGGCHACVNGCDSSHLASEARRGKVILFLVSAGTESPKSKARERAALLMEVARKWGNPRVR